MEEQTLHVQSRPKQSGTSLKVNMSKIKLCNQVIHLCKEKSSNIVIVT